MLNRAPRRIFRGLDRTMITEHSALFSAIRNGVSNVEISEEIYDRFMNVLPPRHYANGFFVFQEGEGDILLFEQIGNRFFCSPEQLDVCTEDWSHFITLKRDDDCFKVKSILSTTESAPSEKFTKFLNTRVASVSALAEALEVDFRP